MKDKKKILVFIDWYVPGFKAGGPIQSVYNIVGALKENYHFYILTSAYDLGETEAYKEIELNQWADENGVLIKYLDRDHIKSSVIKNNVDEVKPDMLYVNGIFSRYFSILPIQIGKSKNIKTIVAPRGMLGTGALDVKKLKKTVFFGFSKVSNMFKDVTWHASSEYEKQDILNKFPKSKKILVSGNIPANQELSFEKLSQMKSFDSVNLVFLGRISKIKNIDKVVQWVKKLQYSKKIVFDIYGGGHDEEFVQEVMAQEVQNNQIEINFKGFVPHYQINDILPKYHYFISMSSNENFGHSIAEAFSNGVPVIISNQTPWKGLISKEIGWDIPIEEAGFIQTLDEAISIDPIDYAKMAQNAYNYFKENIYTEELIASNKKLFEDEGN